MKFYFLMTGKKLIGGFYKVAFISVGIFVIIKSFIYLEPFQRALSNKMLDIVLPHVIYSLLGFIFGLLLYVLGCLLDKKDYRITFRGNTFYKSPLFIVGLGLLICSLIPNVTWWFWLGIHEAGFFGWLLSPMKHITTHLLLSILAGFLMTKSLIQQKG